MKVDQRVVAYLRMARKKLQQKYGHMYPYVQAQVNPEYGWDILVNVQTSDGSNMVLRSRMDLLEEWNFPDDELTAQLMLLS